MLGYNAGELPRLIEYFKAVLQLFTGVLQLNNKLQNDSSQKVEEKKVFLEFVI